MSDWLHDLKPGDEVFVSYGFGCYPATIRKVTARCIYTLDEMFSRKTGELTANPSRCLMPHTDEWCLRQMSEQLLKDRLKELREACARIEDHRVRNNVSATLAAIIAGLKTRTTEDAT